MITGRSYSILVTDDDPAMRETFREVLERKGYRTLLAESGEQAIDIVQRDEIHLALMDLHLPKLDGIETMGIVRQIKGIFPMILVTAERDDSLLRKALTAQAFCVLAKPVSKDMVIYMVTRALMKFY